ncbi:hypothetical protein Glove_384g55 [Diversispora epigaea]|uniref:Uncharacterized protein n=1 Tax=Diversispora epigaea TaxID=1348612 RepID=A0A397H407_9GLOM|nr:hypothetical protein Glove_384g55 [Diversispora epigaea]
MDTKTMFKLMIAANELEFEELFKKLESHLIESKASWLKIRSIFKHNKFKNFGNLTLPEKLEEREFVTFLQRFLRKTNHFEIEWIILIFDH